MLSCFTMLLNQCNGHPKNDVQVLERVASMVPFLKETTNQLSASSESLGAVRQETRVSDLVRRGILSNTFIIPIILGPSIYWAGQLHSPKFKKIWHP